MSTIDPNETLVIKAEITLEASQYKKLKKIRDYIEKLGMEIWFANATFDD